jgi:hypothetical protein
MNLDLLYNTIFERLEKEDFDLTSLTGQGIFYSPELYIAFILGKEIKRKEISIFGEKQEWIRETDFKNGGPTDFAFRKENEVHTYAFELKLRDTVAAYSTDIQKLKRLDNSYTKFFLALVDSWDIQKDKDERIRSLENEHPELKRVANFTSFSTSQKRYKGQICCTVALWTL